ncbi:L,D-transpeptidase family protein [Okeania sp. SIO2B3]|uniref:L,D-transpeptidase family protein n=1 Tax=Okeania sp. SIO2B3 TaxID=2607784 RepID=UPI0013BEE3E1|nr:L,D-transpeptidase family protein [Okeania sp. SIO2B3]NET44843.1 murein L,D-transpeptidase [Okeania sp. SIO2B3]
MSKNFLFLFNTEKKDYTGCNILNLQYIREDFSDIEVIDSIPCCSGSPGRQNFRVGLDSWAGSLEPLPEGKWYVHDIEWAAGIDNYEGDVWSTGIGPVTVPLDYIEPNSTERSAIEIHIDWNQGYSPGTAGCIGLYSVEHMERLVEWLRDTDPRYLYVDWGLGTCPAFVEN